MVLSAVVWLFSKGFQVLLGCPFFGPLANKSSLLLGHLGLCFLAIWGFWFWDSLVPSM